MALKKDTVHRLSKYKLNVYTDLYRPVVLNPTC